MTILQWVDNLKGRTDFLQVGEARSNLNCNQSVYEGGYLTILFVDKSN